MKIFKDRLAAGKLLAKRLKNTRADLVLGIPRGGVVVASEVAKLLKLPLDIIVTRKIGSPGQEELALGALDPDGEVVFDQALLDQLKVQSENLPAGKAGLTVEIQDAWKELKRREDLYRNGKPPVEVQGKRVILVDDGIATGATILAAVKFLKRHGAKVILAVPVASKEAIEKMTQEVDMVIVLDIPEYFQAVGQFYLEFLPVLDEEVVELLNGR